MWYILSSCMHVLSLLVTSFLYAYLSLMHFLFHTVQPSLSSQLCSLYLYVRPCALLNKIFTSVIVLARIDLPLAS